MQIPDPGSSQNNCFLRRILVEILTFWARPEIPDPVGRGHSPFFLLKYFDISLSSVWPGSCPPPLPPPAPFFISGCVCAQRLWKTILQRTYSLSLRHVLREDSGGAVSRGRRRDYSGTRSTGPPHRMGTELHTESSNLPENIDCWIQPAPQKPSIHPAPQKPSINNKNE